MIASVPKALFSNPAPRSTSIHAIAEARRSGQCQRAITPITTTVVSATRQTAPNKVIELSCPKSAQINLAVASDVETVNSK